MAQQLLFYLKVFILLFTLLVENERGRVEWFFLGDMTEDEAMNTLKKFESDSKKKVKWELNESDYHDIINEFGTRPGFINALVLKLLDYPVVNKVMNKFF